MFIDVAGEVHRIVSKSEGGVWIISYENPCSPKFVSEQDLKAYPRIEPPQEYLKDLDRQKNPTDGQQKRLSLIAELMEDEIYIMDKHTRNQKIKELAEREETTVKRIQKLYFRQLAGRSLVEERKPPEKQETQEQKDFRWAVDTFYYSAKKMSLRSAYDMMLLSRYTDVDGRLIEDHPSWYSFRHYFYEGGYHVKSRSTIARNGLTDYQRNHRPLFGSAMSWRDKVGAFQMDATQADIYLVSRLDKSAVIGRPNIYMAVDTVTQLIAGIYVGLDAGEQAVINCLANAATDKVEFCRQFGIDIKTDEWPNTGLPGEIITDKGKEFIGNRMEELAMKYGIEFESLPPFRPDGKSLVEKSFDLIQQKYKPALRGKGVIEADAQERWAVDYRSQAVLTLEDFTKVIIHCVLYLNSCRIIQNCFMKSLDLKKQELEVCSPFQNQKRKELMEEIARTEMEIQSLYDRREKIFKAYKAEPTDPIFPEVIEDKKQRIVFLKGEQAKINVEFWTLVEANRERLKDLRSLRYTNRSQWEDFTKDKLKEHYQGDFNENVYGRKPKYRHRNFQRWMELESIKEFHGKDKNLFKHFL